MASFSFDVVIFSHFITTPWNREKYLQKIVHFEAFNFGNAIKIAFFQDEYFSTDLTAEFIDRLCIDHVYSVAPKSEIKVIYSKVKNKSVSYHTYLTGYVDEADLSYFDKGITRTIDLGYRTGWPSIEMIRLGRFGALKYQIAEVFLKHSKELHTDIKIGEGFLKGKAWFDFLQRCKFMLGVESGASLLDEDGLIYECIKSLHASSKSKIFEEYESNCFSGKDGNLNLKAISPRVFEAAMARTAMVLIEGDYNGILMANRHYLPVKSDFSNVEEVVSKLNDENLRISLVENTYNDLIGSGSYTYQKFIQSFFNELSLKPSNESLNSSLYLMLNLVQDKISWIKVFVWSFLPESLKRKILKN